jgi:hypothetical protein
MRIAASGRRGEFTVQAEFRQREKQVKRLSPKFGWKLGNLPVERLGIGFREITIQIMPESRPIGVRERRSIIPSRYLGKNP